MTSATSRAAALGAIALSLLAGCSTVENLLSGDKVDYRSTSASRASGLEVPPDLTQLAKESRYAQPSGTVSASTFQALGASTTTLNTPTVAVVAPQAVGPFKLERLGNERWLSTTLNCNTGELRRCRTGLSGL